MGCAWFYYYIHAVAFRFNYYFKCQFCELCKLIAIWKYFEEFKTWIVAYSICSHLKLFLKQPELMVLSLVTVFRRNHCSSFSNRNWIFFSTESLVKNFFSLLRIPTESSLRFSTESIYLLPTIWYSIANIDRYGTENVCDIFAFFSSREVIILWFFPNYFALLPHFC